MGIRTKPQASTTWNQRQSEDLWDPRELLEIINPDSGTFTCVGHAPSRGRRCRNPIAANNRNAAYGGLDAMARLEPGSKAAAAGLREIAARSLCVRYHQGQAESVAAGWRRRMNAARISKTQHKSVVDEESDCHGGRAGREETYRFTSQKEMEHILETLERALRAEKIRVKERIESERKERERREREQKKKEQKKREQKKEQKEKEQKKEQKEKEQKKEQKEEKQKKEQKEWALAWDTYTKRWAAFNSMSLHPLLGGFINDGFQKRKQPVAPGISFPGRASRVDSKT